MPEGGWCVPKSVSFLMKLKLKSFAELPSWVVTRTHSPEDLALHTCIVCLGMETGLNFIVSNLIICIIMQKVKEKSQALLRVLGKLKDIRFQWKLHILFSDCIAALDLSIYVLFLLNKQHLILYRPSISSLKLVVTFFVNVFHCFDLLPSPSPSLSHRKFPLLHILPSRSLIAKASNMFPGVQPCGTSLVT